MAERVTLKKAKSAKSAGRTLGRELKSAYPAAVYDRIVKIGEFAEKSGQRAYLVGGCVRDLILKRPNLDIDIVVEGDACALARKCASQLGARAKINERFGTAALAFADGSKIDLASARKEIYPEPAALPVVERSSLEDDLIRRDFTINTLLMRIGPKDFGRLVDLHDGLTDLEAGVIRTLHPVSFVDDPTRLVRAARFEGRFGFRMDA